jgi:4-amino-4-deoxy-L-arabinose transferase-like glycosyltransferase
MWRSNVAIFILLIIANGFFNSHFQLHYDESYYWVWSQNLSFSYFDHPPMIAYMMRLSSLLGYSEFFVRLPALISALVTILIMFKLSDKMFGAKVANITFYLLISWPMLQGIFLVTTPDSPLIMFWSFTLFTFYLGIFEDKVKYIYLSGFCLGLALLSKYTAILLVPGLFLFFIFSKKYRYMLLKKEIYIAMMIALIIALPIFIWNYQHDWISFSFQMNHGYDHEKIFRLDSFSDFILSQLGVGGPVMMIALIYYLIKYNKDIVKDDRLAFLFWPFIFIFLFFAHSSMYAYSGANWTMPGLISGFIILAYYLCKNNNKVVYISSLALISVAILIVKIPTVFLPKYFIKKIDPIHVFYGNKELAGIVNKYLSSSDILYACDYGNASRLWYYLGGKKKVYVLPKFKFANNYQYWSSDLGRNPKDGIFVCDQEIKNNKFDPINTYFKSVTLLDIAKLKNPFNVNHYFIYEVKN